MDKVRQSERLGEGRELKAWGVIRWSGRLEEGTELKAWAVLRRGVEG